MIWCSCWRKFLVKLCTQTAVDVNCSLYGFRTETGPHMVWIRCEAVIRFCLTTFKHTKWFLLHLLTLLTWRLPHMIDRKYMSASIFYYVCSGPPLPQAPIRLSCRSLFYFPVQTMTIISCQGNSPHLYTLAHEELQDIRKAVREKKWGKH